MEISTNFGQQPLYQQNSTLEDFNGKHFNNNSNSNNLNSNKVSTSSQVSQIALFVSRTTFFSSSSLHHRQTSFQQRFQQGSNHTTFAQQSSPIPIDSQRQQQHSPSHHQSYPNNQMTAAEKLMSYRNVNTASPANLSSSQGNLSKVSGRSSIYYANDATNCELRCFRVTNQVRTIDRVLAPVPTTYPPTLTPTQVHHVVQHRLATMGE